MSVRLIKVLVCSGAVFLLAAQEPPAKQEPLPSDTIIRVPVTNVLAPTSVIDKNDGTIVTGLRADQFRLFDNAKQQKIKVDEQIHPLSLVVVVQANAADEKLLPEIMKVGNLVAQVMGEDGEVALLAFDHRVQTLLPFTSEPDKIPVAFQKLTTGSQTGAVNDATMQAVNMLRTRESNRRRVILLIAETRDYGSSIHLRDVLTNAEFNNVTIFSVDISHMVTSLTKQPAVGRGTGIPPEAQHLPAGVIGNPTIDMQMNNNGNWVPLFTEIFKDIKGIFTGDPLDVYTAYTGGREYHWSVRQKALERALEQIGDELHGQYLLSYSPNNQTEAGFHTIVVEVDKPNCEVRTRKGYWTAARPQ